MVKSIVIDQSVMKNMDRYALTRQIFSVLLNTKFNLNQLRKFRDETLGRIDKVFPLCDNLMHFV
jgi:hypothetical protein